MCLGEGSRRLRRYAIFSGVVVLLAMLPVVGRQLPIAVAHHDDCVADSGEWWCSWSDPALNRDTPHWFNADTKLHHWTYAAISDGEGGTVVQKCVHFMRAVSGILEPVACGPGIRDGFPSGSGYLYTRHNSDNPVSITGYGVYR